MYWDGGPNAIEHFLSHHLENCDENYICHKIDMKGLEFDWQPAPVTPVDNRPFDFFANGNNDPQDFESPPARTRSRSVTKSPQRKRVKIDAPPLQTPPRIRTAPLRHGTSHRFLTLEDLRLTIVARISDSES
jgi:hypothetical protein